MKALFGVCLFTCFSLLQAEESLFDFTSAQTSHLPAVQKEKTMRESKLFQGLNPRLKNSQIRGDRKAIVHGHVQESGLRTWEWGFRRSFKLNKAQEGWALNGTYTHFHSKSYASLEKGGQLFPLWHQVESPRAVELGRSSRSKWRLDVDMTDLEVGKSFTVQNFLSMRPHVGVRGALMYQKFNIAYERFERGTLREPLFWNNCVAVGTRGGIDTSWHLGKGFGIFGDGALSWLSGYHNLHEITIPSARMGIAVMESSLGLHYEKRFLKSICLFTVKAGYEFNHFFGQDRWASWFSSMTGEPSQERIALQGLSWSFRLEF